MTDRIDVLGCRDRLGCGMAERIKVIDGDWTIKVMKFWTRLWDNNITSTGQLENFTQAFFSLDICLCHTHKNVLLFIDHLLPIYLIFSLQPVSSGVSVDTIFILLTSLGYFTSSQLGPNSTFNTTRNLASTWQLFLLQLLYMLVYICISKIWSREGELDPSWANFKNPTWLKFKSWVGTKLAGCKTWTPYLHNP